MNQRTVTLLATAAVAAVAALLSPQARAAPAAFTDPAGDSGAAPDVTNVSVSDNGGSITFVVTATALTDGQSLDVFLNTDKNDATGSPSGSEFNLDLWQADGDWGWDTASWAGTDWKETPQNAAEHFSRSGNVFTWTVPVSELGGSKGLTLWVGAVMQDAGGNVTAADRAPDGGSWVYDLSKPPQIVLPALGKPLAVPAAPRAGTLLSLSFPVTRTDTGAPLGGGTVVASATIAGKAIPRTIGLANSTAQVTIAIPKSAKSKTLQVKVTVTVDGKGATRTVTFHVR